MLSRFVNPWNMNFYFFFSCCFSHVKNWRMIGFFCVCCWKASFLVLFLYLGNCLMYNYVICGCFEFCVQSKIQSLAGAHSDVLETLSPNVRKRVESLREIQVYPHSSNCNFFQFWCYYCGVLMLYLFVGLLCSLSIHMNILSVKSSWCWCI